MTPGRLIAIATLGVLMAAPFVLSSWIEVVTGIWGRVRLDTPSALDTLSNAAEVVAAVLAIAITVVAIVVQLAATRYTHRITQLFVRDPINFAVMLLFVVTTIVCLWVSATLPAELGDNGAGASVSSAGVAASMALVTACLVILLPYFGYVFWFLDPLNIVRRIRAQTAATILRASRRHRRGQRAHVLVGVEELEDIALNAMQHRDRAISMASVEALGRLVRDYQPLRPALQDPWYAIDGALTRDVDFVSMAPVVLDEVVAERSWFEMKVLRSFHSLFGSALNGVRDVGYLIALNTRRIASSSGPEYPGLFSLAVRFFNNYLRAAINAEDVRTASYVLHQYRLVAEEALRDAQAERSILIAEHFRFYGLLAHSRDLHFVLEQVAYDLALVAELAVELESPAADALIQVLLRVDKQSESADQESSLRGVRRAQVEFAAFLLARGDRERARRIYEDMENELPERLGAIRDELLAEDRAQYWEVTDRGVNFGYLPPERRKFVPEFFGWFGDRLPPARLTGER